MKKRLDHTKKNSTKDKLSQVFMNFGKTVCKVWSSKADFEDGTQNKLCQLEIETGWQEQIQMDYEEKGQVFEPKNLEIDQKRKEREMDLMEVKFQHQVRESKCLEAKEGRRESEKGFDLEVDRQTLLSQMIVNCDNLTSSLALIPLWEHPKRVQ